MAKKIEEKENEQAKALLDRIIEENLLILDKEEVADATDILSLVIKNKISEDAIITFPEVIKLKPSKVKNVLASFHQMNLPIDILEKDLSILDRTNATRVLDNCKLLEKQDISLNILNKFPEIIAVGNANNMKKIFKLFEKRVINKRFFINAGDVLAYAVADDLEKTMNILDKEDLLNLALRKEPSVLYKNKSDVISDIIKLFKDPKEKLRT